MAGWPGLRAHRTRCGVARCGGGPYPRTSTRPGFRWKIYNHPVVLDRLRVDRHAPAFRAVRRHRVRIEPPRARATLSAATSFTTSPPARYRRCRGSSRRSNDSEHPAHPSAVGAEQIVPLLAALTANPGIWQRTVLIVSYDENGGLFDHVAPPSPPTSESDEYVDAGSGLEPIGLGFRVPCLVISPYTRGGWISSDVLDHTSPLRLVERRFGVPVPNLTAWRRRIVGDMTETFAPWTKPRTGTPAFPRAAGAAHEAAVADRSAVGSADRTRPTPAAVSDLRARQDSRPNRLRLRS